MDHLLELDLKSELGLLILVVNLGFQKGWLTENEQLRIKTKRTLELKKVEFFDILKNTKCDENAAKLLSALRSIEEVKLEPKQYANNDLAEHHYLFIIMSKLYTKGLVTTAERLFYENRLVERGVQLNVTEKENLFGNLEKMEEGATQREIDEFQNGNNKRNPAENITNTMLICLIIKCLLKYLDFEEVKNTRYISKVWSSVGLNVLKTRSIMEFSQKRDADPRDMCPINFLSIFPNETLETVPFTNYSFIAHKCSTPWTTEELNYFFRNQRKHITELSLNGVSLVNENWQPLKNYDISPWLHNAMTTKPNAKYNTIFGILVPSDDGNGSSSSTMLFVELSALVNIQELFLFNCGLQIQEGTVISPIVIKIHYICIQRNGNQLTQICINDIIDFSKAKEIYLSNSDREENKTTKLILDMGRNSGIKLERLILRKITLSNVTSCRWTVNHFYLKEIPFTERSKMEIKRLSITSSPVDISILPQSLEKLIVFRNNERNCVCTQQIILNNLKVMKLYLNIEGEIPEPLNFRSLHCPFLVELHLVDMKRNSPFCKEINLSWIPQTLKTLKLVGICIKDEGNSNTLTLDKLVLSNYKIEDVEKVCRTHIQTTELLVLSFPYEYILSILDSLLSFLNDQTICRGLEQSICVGHFNWTDYTEIEFEESPLTGYVDKKSEYYAFKNKVGKAIDVEEFVILMDGNLD